MIAVVENLNAVTTQAVKERFPVIFQALLPKLSPEKRRPDSGRTYTPYWKQAYWPVQRCDPYHT